MTDPSFAALRARLESAGSKDDRAREPAPPSIDVRAAALAGLMVAEVSEKEPGRGRLARLGTTGEFDVGAVVDLALASRALLYLQTKMPRPSPVGLRSAAIQRIEAAAEPILASMTRVLDTGEHEIHEARQVLDYVSLGRGPAELAQNLRILAALYAEHGATLKATCPGFEPAREAEARATADALSRELESGLDAGDARETRVWLGRAYAFFEHAYEEVGRAGRFLY
ncbi:hypothetical protein EON77_19705, partial [bacterium]